MSMFRLKMLMEAKQSTKITTKTEGNFYRITGLYL